MSILYDHPNRAKSICAHRSSPYLDNYLVIRTDMSYRRSAEPCPRTLPTGECLSMGMEEPPCPTKKMNEMLTAMRSSLERQVIQSVQQYTRETVYEPAFKTEISNMFFQMKIMEALKSLLPAELQDILTTLDHHNHRLLQLGSSGDAFEAYIRDRMMLCERKVGCLQGRQTRICDAARRDGDILFALEERMKVAERRIQDLESENCEMRDEIRKMKRHVKHVERATEHQVEKKLLKRRIGEIESQIGQDSKRMKTT